MKTKKEEIKHGKRGKCPRCGYRLEEHPTGVIGQPYCEFKLIKIVDDEVVEADESDFPRTKENQLAYRHISLLPDHLQ